MLFPLSSYKAKRLKFLVTAILLLTATYTQAQHFDDELYFRIRGTADSVSTVNKLAWPPGNEETEEDYKLQDSVMYRYTAVDTIRSTQYHYEVHFKDAVYVLNENGDLSSVINHMPDSKKAIIYNYVYKPTGSGNIPSYTEPTLYTITDAKRHTDTVLHFIAVRKAISKTIRRYDDKGRVAEEWRTNIIGQTLHSQYEYGLYDLCSKAMNYRNDTLQSTDTYEYVFDSHGNFTKRKQYTNGRIINVLYRRIYYN